MKISSNQDAHEKKAYFSADTSAFRRLNFGIFHQLQTNGKYTKNRISCLRLFVHDVWIYTCLSMDYLSISCLFEETPGV